MNWEDIEKRQKDDIEALVTTYTPLHFEFSFYRAGFPDDSHNVQGVIRDYEKLYEKIARQHIFPPFRDEGAKETRNILDEFWNRYGPQSRLWQYYPIRWPNEE